MNYSKEINAMKNIIGSLELKQNELEEKVSTREDYFNDRSEKWQESQSGLDYQEKTEHIDSVCSELTNMISDIEMHIESLESF